MLKIRDFEEVVTIGNQRKSYRTNRQHIPKNKQNFINQLKLQLKN